MATPYEIIDRKKRGGRHEPGEIAALVAGATDGSIPDYQLAAWLMAVWFEGLDDDETLELTTRMRESGDQLDLSPITAPTADKHSTGGIGDKVSLVLAPLAAELGMAVPMLSGRGLGHTGGTLDKLESIPGYRIDLSPAEMVRQVAEIGCCISGQTGDIAPADRRLYHLRDVTATVDCVPLITASILSKKLAAGPRHLVIDLKCGSGAFMRDVDGARELARALVRVATAAGRDIRALVTDMGQPLGRAVGHALEAREALACLQGGGPDDLRELTVELVAAMGELSGLGTREQQREAAGRALDDGSALARFGRMVEAQGGRLGSDDPASALEVAPGEGELVAAQAGYAGPMDAAAIGLSLLELGGARRRSDDALDLATGVEVLVAVGDELAAGQPMARIHARDGATAAACRERLARAMPVVEEPPARVPLVLEEIAP